MSTSRHQTDQQEKLKELLSSRKSKSGTEIIASCVQHLPPTPGVYRMLDAEGTVLYVGKAKNLKKRVSSYTDAHRQIKRISYMILLTREMEFISTETEAEALLLEANLIKRLKPRFNIVLRDNKSFPYILVTRNHPAPRILKHRGSRKLSGDYFGPFASAAAVNATIRTLQSAFLLRSCSDSVYANRTRPCLLYQVKRCSGPCAAKISPVEYNALVREASDFLSGKGKNVRQQLIKLMQKTSNDLNFERAAIYRDRLSALSYIHSDQGFSQGVEKADIFAIQQKAGQHCVQVFFFRNGQNWGNKAYFPSADPDIPAQEVLTAFLSQFYENTPLPPLILLSQSVLQRELLEKAFKIRAKQRVRISVPKRGKKHMLVTCALENAKNALNRKITENTTQAQLLEKLASFLNLDRPPQRIEVYDNSHLQGSQAVGVMIVAGPDGFIKEQYRKFNIQSSDISDGDDYAMMLEVLTRRCLKLRKEINNKNIPQGHTHPLFPDLIIIDGGQGHVTCAYGVLEKHGFMQIPLLGIAKGADRKAGKERFFIADRGTFMLGSEDPVFYFMQKLRDEAHRFAVGTHRTKRKRSFMQSPLREISGLGEKRKYALLRHFGSVRAVSRASRNDLEAVEGIGDSMAHLIYDHFHSQKD
ncbi:MAG: excinuclease ABC subunit UvrC [Alphaproteobacteria bacterium]|nr:excinuclease ABC subunit UvrC [Alphaproteobacteria bacterium]